VYHSTLGLGVLKQKKIYSRVSAGSQPQDLFIHNFGEDKDRKTCTSSSSPELFEEGRNLVPESGALFEEALAVLSKRLEI